MPSHPNKGENDNRDETSGKHKVEEPSRPNALQILSSVFAALIGVQSEKRREQDFNQGRAGDYILYGILGVIVLIFGMILLVKQVIE